MGIIEVLKSVWRELFLSMTTVKIVLGQMSLHELTLSWMNWKRIIELEENIYLMNSCLLLMEESKRKPLCLTSVWGFALVCWLNCGLAQSNTGIVTWCLKAENGNLFILYWSRSVLKTQVTNRKPLMYNLTQFYTLKSSTWSLTSNRQQAVNYSYPS